MKHLFVMDPLDRIVVAGDSTFTLMREATRRDHESWWCTPEKLFVVEGQAWAVAQRVDTSDDDPHFQTGQTREVRLGDLDVVWMRKDPPFDMTYIFATYQLDLVPPPTLVVNDPRGLKLFNEKIWAMHFAEFQPPTLLSRDKERLRRFVAAQPHGAVLKPWDGNGGRGVLIARTEDRNLPSMIELLTDDGRHAIIAQAFVPGVRKGDKRILLLEGEPVAAINRVPGPTDHRANMHVGGQVKPCELDDRDRAICAALRQPLKDHGQIFVGIDVIDGLLTEINVTSPTGFREVQSLYGLDLAAMLMDRVAAASQRRRRAS